MSFVDFERCGEKGRFAEFVIAISGESGAEFEFRLFHGFSGEETAVDDEFAPVGHRIRLSSPLNHSDIDRRMRKPFMGFFPDQSIL